MIATSGFVAALECTKFVFSSVGVGWQVTLCDPIWHVCSHCGVAG